MRPFRLLSQFEPPIVETMTAAKAVRSRGKADVPRKRGVLAALRAGLTEESWWPLIALIGLFAVTQAWAYNEHLVCMDYYQFWVIGQALRQAPVGDIYSSEERARIGEIYWQKVESQIPDSAARAASKQYQAALRRKVLETYSTPWLYTLVGLSSTGNYDRDRNRFLHFSLLCHLLAIAVLCRVLAYPPAAGILALVVFLNWFAPTLSDAHVGNVNRLQLAMLAFFLAVESWSFTWRHVLGGFVLGCAVMFKPNLAFVPLVLGLGWMLQQRYRKLIHACGGMAAGCLTAFGIATWYFGSARAWLSWAGQVPKLLEEYDHALSKGNFSLARVIHDTTSFSDTQYLPLLLLGLIALAVVGARLKNVGGSPVDVSEASDEKRLLQFDVLLVGLGGSVALLSAQLAWLHYFVLTIPLALYLLRPGDREASSSQPFFRTLALLAVAMIALEAIISIFGLNEGDPGSATLVCGGAVILFVLALVDCWQFRFSSTGR